MTHNRSLINNIVRADNRIRHNIGKITNIIALANLSSYADNSVRCDTISKSKTGEFIKYAFSYSIITNGAEQKIVFLRYLVALEILSMMRYL